MAMQNVPEITMILKQTMSNWKERRNRKEAIQVFDKGCPYGVMCCLWIMGVTMTRFAGEQEKVKFTLSCNTL